MGYQTGKGRFSFHFVDDDNGVSVLGDALEFLEYPYNILACQSWYADGNLSDHHLQQIEDSLLTRELLGVARANCTLRHLVPSGASLTVVRLQMTSPVEGQYRGIAEAIGALVDLLDPLKWADKWENLRHKRVMNRQQERQNFIKTKTQSLAGAEKALRSMTNLLALLERFERALGRDMPRDQARAYADAVKSELLSATSASLKAGVEVRGLPEAAA